MTTAELETELARHRGEDLPVSGAIPLSIDQALRYRDEGNVPDERGRTLRLVLHVDDRADLRALDAKRSVYEPDYHESPGWRRQGSVPVNVVPLQTGELEPAPADPWWNDSELAALEAEWARSGTVAGVRVPGPYRGLVYKTVISLRSAGIAVTAETVAGSIARWLPEHDADRLRRVLEEHNRD
jgi:hypothetical protein